MPLTTADNAQGIVSRHLIDIDTEMIYQAAKVGPHRPTKSKPLEHKPDFLLLPLDQNFNLKASIRLEPDRYGQYVEGVDTFSGLVNGDETTSFVISVENQQLNGQVRLGSYLIKINHDSKLNTHVMSLVDLRLMPKDSKEADYMREISKSSGINSQPGILPGTSGTQSSSSSAGQGNIRVLFYFTPAVAARNNVNAMVANILSELNTSIDLSRINPEVDFTLAGIIQLANNMAGVCKVGNPWWSADSVWMRIRNRSFPFANVDADILQANADISLSILTAETGDNYIDCAFPSHRLGGVAAGSFQISEPHAMTTDTYAMGDLTAAHEIGHVLGGDHEIEQTSFNGTPAFARGYASNGETWQTIMGGYAGGCPFVELPGQPTCIRLNRWSNPTIAFQGEYTGVANESDMESALEFTAPIVSGWTSYPTPVTTNSPTISDFGSCSQVSWGFISGSTHYQVFKSTSSSFPGGGNRLGITIFPGFSVNIPYAQTEYFRVRACNGNGCGPFSNTLPITNNLNCL